MIDLLDLPPDDDAFVDELSDDAVKQMALAIIAMGMDTAWAQIVGFFPVVSEWSPQHRQPPDYPAVIAWRIAARAKLDEVPELAAAAKRYYRGHVEQFIDHWCITYDPRNASRSRPTKMPFVQFKRQREFVAFLLACLAAENDGAVDKSRDMGATWVAGAFSIALWLFWPGAAVGWGSRKEDLVDKLGDPDSIFEKMRMIVRELPPQFLPAGFNEADHMTFMKFINPETGATVTGESGDNIGRGGRSLIYFKDEAAHYARPELVEAALGDNTNVQIDISTVNGIGNVFHRKLEAGLAWAPGDEMTPGRTAIFVMDWRDHPMKTQAWYEQRRQKAIDQGLLHKFKQEVDRDPSGAVEGTIIPAEWVRSAIGARERLGIADRGMWRAALDVADGGGDTNALTLAKGIEIKTCDQWGAPDVGVTARRAIDACAPLGEVDLQYDAVGVGSGVKAEANRLEAIDKLPRQLRLIPWNAGAKVQDPDKPMFEGDMESPMNGDYFYNFKAQAWWRVRERFQRTHRAILALEGGPEFTYDPDELISLHPDLPLLPQIQKELSQPTATKETRSQKLLVNKTPEGTHSPNLADSIVMAFNPVEALRPVYTTSLADISQDNFKVPEHWLRGFGMKVESAKVTALWGAFDKESDILYIVAEHRRDLAEPSANAAAIASRGAWIPGFIETDTPNIEHLRQTLAMYDQLGLKVHAADPTLEAGITDMAARASTGRLKAFISCTQFFADYRAYRLDEQGHPLGSGLMDCARILCRPTTLGRLIARPPKKMIPVGTARNPYR